MSKMGQTRVRVFDGGGTEVTETTGHSVKVTPQATTSALGKVGHDTTGLAGGRKTVDSAGTRQAIATSTAAKWVIITAETDNTNPVTVGGSDVVGALATRVGTPLYAGESVTFLIDNLADVYVDVITNGEGVTFTYGT